MSSDKTVLSKKSTNTLSSAKKIMSITSVASHGNSSGKLRRPVSRLSDTFQAGLSRISINPDTNDDEKKETIEGAQMYGQ